MSLDLQLKAKIGCLYSQGGLCFANNSSRLWSAGGNTLNELNFESSSARVLPCEPRADIRLIACDLDDRFLALADALNRITLYSVERGIALGDKRFKERIHSIAFSVNRRMLAVASGDCVELFALPERCGNVLLEPFLLLKRHNIGFSAELVVFAGADCFLILGGDDGAARMQSSLPEKVCSLSFTLNGHKARVAAVIEDIGEGWLLTADMNGLVLLWSWNAEEERPIGSRHSRQNVSDSTALTEIEQKYSNGKFLLENKRLVFKESASVASITHTERLLAFAFTNSTVSIYSVKRGDDLLQLQLSFQLEDGPCRTFAFHRSQPVLALSTAPTNTSSSTLVVFDYRAKNYLQRQVSLRGCVSAAAFNDRGWLAVGDFYGAVRLFDVDSQLNFVTFEHAFSRVSALCFRDATTLLAVSLDGHVRAYDLRQFKLFRELKPDAPTQLLALASDGRDSVFAGAAEPFHVFCWSLRTGELLLSIPGHLAPVFLLRCLPMSGQLLSAAAEPRARLCSPFAKSLAQETLEVGDRVVDICAARDEKSFFVATARNEVHVFDQSGSLTALLGLREQIGLRPLSRIEISFDNNTLLAAGADNCLAFFDVSRRCALGGVRLTRNARYRAPGKRNSRGVVDGMEIAALELNRDGAKGRRVLPGSAEARHKKSLAVEEVVVSQLLFSADGRYLCVASNESTGVFERRTRRAAVAAPALSTAELGALLERGRLVEFVAVCLRLGEAALVAPLLPRLSAAQARDLAAALGPAELELFLRALSRALGADGRVAQLLAALEQTLLVHCEALAQPQNAYIVKEVICGVSPRAREFAELCAANEGAFDYLLKHLQIAEI